MNPRKIRERIFATMTYGMATSNCLLKRKLVKKLKQNVGRLRNLRTEWKNISWTGAPGAKPV